MIIAFLSSCLFYLLKLSAGTGRIETFKALDALQRQGVEKGKINIVEYLYTMRSDRMNMIQNLMICFFLLIYFDILSCFTVNWHL